MADNEIVPKCARETCKFGIHPNARNNNGKFCCRCCLISGGHGPGCQRKLYEENIIIDKQPILNNPLPKRPIITYFIDTYPSIGGVARYETQIKMIFPHRKYFNPNQKANMINYLHSICNQNPIVITDNHLACDIPNIFHTILVHHGIALTHREREKTWNHPLALVCCNGQKKMLFDRNPLNTHIVSISQFCTDEFTRHYPERYPLFPNTKILHSSEFNEEQYKMQFNNCPIVLGNWGTITKGKNIIPKLQQNLQNFVFQTLSIKPNVKESIESFNIRKQKMYLDSDIFLQISSHEGNSYASLDALLCGLIVIATNVGLFYKDVPEDCFVKLDWNKSNDMNYCLEKIKYGWENRESISKNARNWYMQNARFVDWKKKMTDLVHTVYNEKK